MDRLSLLLGESYNKIGNLLIKHPTLKDILDYSDGAGDAENKYMYSVSLMTTFTDLEKIAHILWVEHKLWYKDLDPWLFFVELYKKDQKVRDVFQWWTGRRFGVIFDKDKPPYLYDQSDGLILTMPVLVLLVNFVKQVNFIPLVDKSRVNFGKREKTAKRYYKRRYEVLKKKKLPPDTDFASIVSSIACKMQCSPTDLTEYTVYQIWDRFYRVIQIDKYDKTMFGYYGGNIKKKDLNLKSINWSKIIIIDKTKESASGDTTFNVAHS